MKMFGRKAPPPHAHLALQGIVFGVDLHTPRGKVVLPATVKIADDKGTLSTDPEHPVEFGRPGKHGIGVKTGIRIQLDRADATDLRVAQTFLEECLALTETGASAAKTTKPTT